MLVILSPSKTQEFTSTRVLKTHDPVFMEEITALSKKLRGLSSHEISKLMDISPKLAALNHERFQNFKLTRYTDTNSKAAILAYQGDVYQGLAAETFSDDDIQFAEQHLLILSGFYGVVRPLDHIQAYRLEMSVKLSLGKFKNLYAFWQAPLNHYIQQGLKTEKFLVNLASEEYAKVLDRDHLTAQLIKVEFKDKLRGKYQIVGLKAKKARGLMARFIIKNRLEHPDELKRFDTEGYQFMEALSAPQHLIFHRD
jgi:uncharacterized protein